MSSETTAKSGIHPLVAGAAVAVIIASGVGIAAITGTLPGSSAQKAEEQAKPATAQAAPQQAQQQHKQAAKPHEAAKPHAQAKANAPVQVASAPQACVTCGTVVDVKLVEDKGKGTGVGAVGGAVVGGVVAHEVFDGKNQGLATIAGAAGGALAGNEIEKNVRTKKHYEVAVRMEDGSTKSIAFAEQPSWKAGDKVKVEGAKIEPR